MDNVEWGRVVFFGLWGGGVVVAYSLVLWKRSKTHRHHRDRRSMRDLVEGAGLWLVATTAALATASVVFFPEAVTMRGLLNSIALGSFLGVGIIMATEEQVKR